MTVTGMNGATSKSVDAWATAILVALLVVFAGIALFHASAGAFFRVPQNFNEGWNAYFARAAFSGALYFPFEAPVTNNYPPLSFYLLGGLARLGGDPIYIGRAVSAAALAAVGLNIYAILRRFQVDRPMAASVAIAFLAFIAIGYTDYVATNDPQWLAHAVMTSGLTLFLRRYPSRGAVAGAALVMLAAGLIKHNLLPVPLAVTVWLLLYDRPRLWLWLAVSAAGAAAAIAAIWGLYGADALAAIFLMKRLFYPLQAANAVYQYVSPALPLIVVAVASGVLSDRRAQLLFLYVLFALGWDVLTMAYVGVAYNGILDFYIAVALLTGLAMRRLTGTARVAGLAAVVLPIVLVASHMTKPHRVWQEYRQIEQDFREDEALVRSAAGPAMCYTAALCYWAGKDFEYDHFNEIRKMSLDPAYRKLFIKRLDDKYFAIIQLIRLETLPIHHLQYMPLDVIAAIQRNYMHVKESKTGRNYFRPRP